MNNKQSLPSVTHAVKQGVHILCLTLSFLHAAIWEVCEAKTGGIGSEVQSIYPPAPSS